ncbi:MAG: bifunctional phosphopantothenoylcysteine decarboxylase/phosphopantothenate--cysteine ligase CoaBC [Crocinitomicaceae bacterium]|jgi:phosphopantothenoylcysteine decarboxylase/phosphopantothenate--cysteine ligase|nr:bifunctional phosphopantothenoylcysteine decarboxylase/phosphopantothenate--cysteine ligase CoaBC [Crocinitomicaceae bacterium]MDG2463878.1 bifunctional phosphopantothenoylcysteine decarboxylase/phosphopantothenate--cysteine ligase CoaBC [Crocinitomicaceae bacterium]
MQTKRILLGITGGIAAYKIASLVRLLIKSGAEVRCIMTPASCDFITPLTLATLSKNEVIQDFWDEGTGEWANHVELGMWPDVFLIAPVTASSMSKMVHGQSDNVLMATYLSAKCPVIVAPAMDLDMYKHPTTSENLKALSAHGVDIIPPNSGELASGLEGEGRMAEPEEIHNYLNDFFSKGKDFVGKKVLITAGPTHEAIDPVRFIGNHSSGKMGVALAKSFLKRGAEVTLVLGPSKENCEHPNLTLKRVVSAEEMLEMVQKSWKSSDIGVFSAAVADYRPKKNADQKIKKNSDELTVELVKNPDILKWAGENKSAHQVLIGFALETENERVNAKGKLEKKNLDIIVLNSLNDSGAGFAHNTNKIAIFDKHNNSQDFELTSKKVVAENILDYFKNFKKNEK